MGIFDKLTELGEFKTKQAYNGKLKDFLYDCKDDPYQDLIEEMFKENEEIWMYKNYDLNYNLNLIANQKIGYRDVKKIPQGTMKIPYIFYWKNDKQQVAIVLNTDSYIEARGDYYCLTEDGNFFEEVSNQLLVMYLNEENYHEVASLYHQICDNHCSIGYLQRKLDMEQIGDVDEMKEKCIEIAEDMFDSVKEKLLQVNDKEKGNLIYRTVGRTFLLKKSLYVRYMSNKKLLQERHSNNVKEQRAFAKCYIDEIPITSYYGLWNLGKEDKKEK